MPKTFFNLNLPSANHTSSLAKSTQSPTYSSSQSTRGSESRVLDQKTIQLSQLLTRTLNTHGLKLESLGIIPGETCWVIRVDVLVLHFGGCVLDAITLAVRAAMITTRIPKAKVEEVDGHYDFEIGDDDTELLAGASQIPICVTLNQIGERHVIDASSIEEECASVQVAVMVGRDGKLCGMQKTGSGCINPSRLIAMVNTARQVGSEHLKEVDAFLEKEALRKLGHDEMVGFLA
jgi:exosome complex component RRP42